MTGVGLLPVPRDVAVAVVGGCSLDHVLARLQLTRSAGWPHTDTGDALRPLAEHGTGHGTFLVVRQGAVLGECGWFGPPDAEGAVEIGYGLAVPSRRQGLGREAVQLLLDWIWTQPEVRVVTAEVLVGNEASLRLLAGLGFATTGREGPYVRLHTTG